MLRLLDHSPSQFSHGEEESVDTGGACSRERETQERRTSVCDCEDTWRRENAQVQNIIRDAETILDRWTRGDAGDSKIPKRMKTQFSDLNDQVWEWFCDARSRKVPVSGVLIQEQALRLSVLLDMPEFTALNGWLQRWLLMVYTYYNYSFIEYTIFSYKSYQSLLVYSFQCTCSIVLSVISL